MKEYLSVVRQYAVFSGRSSRKQYWLFYWITSLLFIGLTVVDNQVGTAHHEGGIGWLGGLYALGLLVPTLAVTVRRLHDSNRSGWWFLTFLVPVIGLLVWLFMMIEAGTPGANRYGQRTERNKV
ncbi:MAG: DUF805 domain-containing protein [Pseudomonadota bacterium]